MPKTMHPIFRNGGSNSERPKRVDLNKSEFSEILAFFVLVWFG
jgi:hypothetical protein